MELNMEADPAWMMEIQRAFGEFAGWWQPMRGCDMPLGTSATRSHAIQDICRYERGNRR